MTVLDPFAGGGSIPFEALRYGFVTIANDLNPVASVVEIATLDYPARFGATLTEDIRRWGFKLNEIASKKLSLFFPMQSGEQIRRYFWVRTVPCPVTGKPIPLSPNWWLRKGAEPVAVKLVANEHMEEPHFSVIRGTSALSSDPDNGTLSRGNARSPWTGETISGEYIKAEAQAGRMGQVLYAMSIQTEKGNDFRSPTDEDLEAIARSEILLEQKKPLWIAENVIPVEEFPEGNDNRPLMYGMRTWSDFFAPRQLLTMGVYMEALREIEQDMLLEMAGERAGAILTYCGIILNKCPNYNSLLSSWHVSREVITLFLRKQSGFQFVHANRAGFNSQK